MYGIAGYAFPFFENKKIDDRPARAPKITNRAGIMLYACMNTPAVIIGKITSPPPRIAKLILNFFCFIFFGIFLPLYFSFSFFICALTLSEADGIRKPPNIFISSIWNFAIFCMMPERQTAHMS